MKRSGFKPRTKPLRASQPARTSSDVRRPRQCRVKLGGCGESFYPERKEQIACSPACAKSMAPHLNAKKAEAKRKEEARNDRKRREGLRTISQLEEDCRKIVQEIARLRDRHDGCISCHVGPNYGGIWHGSHYRAHGACSSLQFHLWNIHKACEQCNFFKGGNKEGYIAGLLVKPGYGRERLEWLDNQPKSQRFTRDYLLRFKSVMGKRLRRMRKTCQ